MSRLRTLRVQEALQEEISRIISKELKDPRIGFASVIRVEVGDDLRHARVFVSVLGDEDSAQATLKAFSRVAGFIRGEVGRRLRLRHAPEIAFVWDRSLERNEKVARLIERARAEASPEEVRALERSEIVAALREGERFLVPLHVRPDGDSIGSSLALAGALQKMGKTALVVRADDLPANLSFLPGVDRVVHWEEVMGAPGRYDAAILIDCGDIERVGPSADLFKRVDRIINIDHHVSNTRYGGLNLIDPRAAAAAEVVFDLIREMEVEIDYPIAVALYAAIVTDTGSFRYESTAPRTHEITAVLLKLGIKPGEVSRQIWDNQSLAALRLAERALGSLQVDAGGGLAWVSLSRADFVHAGADDLESEGIVNYPRQIRGVEVAVLFIEEREPGSDHPGEVKVSLRSNQSVDVSRIAGLFGGGGHARAAGCTVPGGLDEARELVLPPVREALAD